MDDFEVDFQDFLDKLYSLNPVGDANVIYSIMLRHLGCRLNDGTPLTFDFLIKRYSDYLLYVKPYNDIKDKQYIKKEMLRKEIGAYIISEMYKSDYSTLLYNESDFYLFGI